MSGLTRILDEESEREAAEAEAALAGRGIGSSREVRERGPLEGRAYLAVEHGRYDDAFTVMIEALGYGPKPAEPSPRRGGLFPRSGPGFDFSSRNPSTQPPRGRPAGD